MVDQRPLITHLKPAIGPMPRPGLELGLGPMLGLMPKRTSLNTLL